MKLYPIFSPTLLGSATELITRNLKNPENKPALGSFADYRIELQIALLRALEMREEETGIFVSSVLDNIAYNYVNYEDFTRSNIVDEGMDSRNYLTAATLYAILVDSLAADVIAFLPLGEQASTDAYSYRVDKFYPEIFEFFSIKPITLGQDLKENVKVLSDEVKRLQKEAHGQRNDNQELSEEDS